MIATIWSSIVQTGQSTVFGSIGLLGFVYLMITALTGGFGHDADGHDVHGGDSHGGDGHNGEATISVFSPKVIAIFLVTFGGVGMIASNYGKSAWFSVFAGLCSGIVLAILALVLLRMFYRQQATSIIDTNLAVDQVGQVTIGIPEGGVGEVGVTVAGSYSSYSARSEDGKPISNGRRVKIKSNAGGQLVVEAT